MKDLFIIAARAANGVIGKDDMLPWRIPADLARFKRLTMGCPMIMGRTTFDSLPGILPGRRHIVMTRDPDWEADDAEVAHDFAAALRRANAPHIAVIGGAQIYAEALPHATRIELTEVHRDYDGDTAMPEIDAHEWEEIAREDHPEQGSRPAFSFVTLRRNKPVA